MSCNCLDPSDYQCTSIGSFVLANTSLTWLLTTDGLTGTPPTEPDIPNGNLNQMFWKLLQNDCAIASFIQNSFTRTYGATSDAAPAVDVLPGTMTGAPGEPVEFALHTIFFNDYEVHYRFVEDAWVEIARAASVTQVAQIRTRKLTIPLTSGDDEIPFAIPDEDDNSNSFAFTIDDLALLYINNTDLGSPVVAALPGYNVTGAVVRLALSAEIPVDSTYELIAIFRRTVLS